jgi:uncharacterized protein (TIGR02145 family)
LIACRSGKKRLQPGLSPSSTSYRSGIAFTLPSLQSQRKIIITNKTMKKPALLLIGMLFLISGIHAQTVTDYDGNVYDTVVIGTQVWLKQNLRTTHFNDGTYIPVTTDSTEWTNTITGSRCYYNNDSTAYDTLYGALYNGYSINHAMNVCPVGWHISTNEEWEEAESFLGGFEIVGGKMKEAGTVHWTAPNNGATNSSGFDGLPGGMRDLLNTYVCLGENGLWWTATSYNESTYWTTYLDYLSEGVDHNPAPKNYGLSIRCVRDVVSGSVAIRRDRDVIIFPNPATDKITMDFSGNEDLSVRLLNMAGSCIMHGRINRTSNEIDIESLSKGVYIIEISGADWTSKKKIVKE